MSDYSYYVVREEPPRPRLRFRTWLLSWLTPVTVWTVGSGFDGAGEKVARRPWVVERGMVDRGRIDHTCSADSSCECVTGRRR